MLGSQREAHFQWNMGLILVQAANVALARGQMPVENWCIFFAKFIDFLLGKLTSWPMIFFLNSQPACVYLYINVLSCQK